MLARPHGRANCERLRSYCNGKLDCADVSIASAITFRCLVLSLLLCWSRTVCFCGSIAATMTSSGVLRTPFRDLGASLGAISTLPHAPRCRSHRPLGWDTDGRTSRPLPPRFNLRSWHPFVRAGPHQQGQQANRACRCRNMLDYGSGSAVCQYLAPRCLPSRRSAPERPPSVVLCRSVRSPLARKSGVWKST